MDASSNFIRNKLGTIKHLFNNPFNNPVGQLVDTSTVNTSFGQDEDDPFRDNPEPPFQLFLDLCDLINTDPSEMNMKFLVVAVKKKLSDRDPVVVENVLNLLEFVVKNCAQNNEDVFHRVVLGRELLKESLLPLVLGRQLPTEISDHVLSLIQSWASVFRNNVDVMDVFEELRERGVEFPPVDLDKNVPVVLKKVAPVKNPTSISNKTEKYRKIYSDMKRVKDNLEVFNELMDEPQLTHEDEQLLLDLRDVLTEMMIRIEEIIVQRHQRTDPEFKELVSDLLHYDRDIKDALLRCHEMGKD